MPISRSFCLRPVAALVLFYSAHAGAAEGASDVFQLGEIEVSSTAESSELSQGFGAETISADSMKKNFATDVGQALSHITGVTPTVTGQRAETQVYIRGFNQNQVSLNIDGIPVYVPYDGNVDLGRLLTGNLSQIVVTKGLGSLMYGPNNMGGSINLITKRPDAPFSADLSGGTSYGLGNFYSWDGSLQIGSRINDQWYVTGGAALSDSAGFPLSSDFTPVAAQPSGGRVNAESHIGNYNFKVGFTPNATDEYAFGLSTVNSTKQDPPYTGNTAVTGQKVSYWDWPQWNKQSYYFLSNTGLGSGYLKTRIYYDSFTNQLLSYDDARYATTAKPFAFNSKYDDHSSGVDVEWDQPLGSANLLKVAGFYKNDVHTENDWPNGHKAYQSPWLEDKAHIYSLGAEDTWTPDKATEVTVGYRHDRHEFDQAQHYTDGTAPAEISVTNHPVSGPTDANNWQITAQRSLAEAGWGDTVVRAGIGRKTRFPGIKDVYSYKLGTAIPNPALGAESALNREIGAAGHLWQASYDLALYWDSISSAIESVSVAPGLSQNQNVGTATNKGVDLNLTLPFAKGWSGSLLYSYLSQQLAAANLVPTGTPKNRGEVSVAWTASETLDVSATVQGNSRIQTATNGLQPVSGNAVANLNLTDRLSKSLTLNGGIYNLFDRNYALVEGFPMPGRMLKVALSYHH